MTSQDKTEHHITEHNKSIQYIQEIGKIYENEVRVCIAIQKIGRATVPEINKKLQEEGIKITEKKIAKACVNLQKRGLVSLNYDNTSGYAEKAYSMSKAIFSRDIPIAHYKDIVDTNDPDIQKLITELEEKKGTSKKRLPDIRDYFTCEVKFEVVDKVLGFMPFNEEGFNQHYRIDGELVLLPQHFRAWLATNLRVLNKCESVARQYIGFGYGKVSVKGSIGIDQYTILDGNQGKGIIKYEAIPAGSTITTKFRVPATEFTSDDFRKFLIDIGEMPIRGLSGRAITGYGHLKIIEFKIL